MTGRRQEVLTVLRSSGAPMSIADIARRLDLHPNTVRFHLQALTDNGQVERVEPERTAPGRPPLMFRVHQGMDPSGPRNYRLLAEVLAVSLAADPHPADRALEVGRAWGSRLAAAPPGAAAPSQDDAVDRLVGILADLGFAPEQLPSPDGRQIGLRHCPFLDLVEDQARVICPVHLGLMQGAMTTMEAPVTVDQLESFVEPDLCIAHLSTVR